MHKELCNKELCDKELCACISLFQSKNLLCFAIVAILCNIKRFRDFCKYTVCPLTGKFYIQHVAKWLHGVMFRYSTRNVKSD
jgi:hypothetical protein